MSHYGRKKDGEKKEKAHIVVRNEKTHEYHMGVSSKKNPYFKPLEEVTKWNQEYRHENEWFVPSIFGGNVEDNNRLKTLTDEVWQESKGSLQLIESTIKQSKIVPVPKFNYDQFLYTGLVKKGSGQLTTHEKSSPAFNETHSIFSTSLTSLNKNKPLTFDNFDELFKKEYLDNVKEKPTEKGFNQRMEWHTLKFAKDQILEDNSIFQKRLETRKKEFVEQASFNQAGFKRPRLKMPTDPYKKSIFEESDKVFKKVKRDYMKNLNNEFVEKMEKTDKIYEDYVNSRDIRPNTMNFTAPFISTKQQLIKQQDSRLYKEMDSTERRKNHVDKFF